MFRSKTVFILGAGASHEIGLPIGEGLKEIIAEKLNIQFDWNKQISGDKKITQAIKNHAIEEFVNLDIRPYMHAALKLSDALPQAISIDNLLDAYRGQKNHEVCGKLGIVSSILEAEKSSSIYHTHEQIKMDFKCLRNTWFSGFMKILTENIPHGDIEQIFDNLSIINFNYDRCVEHYLYESLQNYYTIDEKSASYLMSKLNILHPYGCLGNLPWQEQNHLLQVPFGSEKCDILRLSKGIKTFNESIHETSEISALKNLIENAEIIVFLGFAFHRQNLELIAPENPSKARRVFATAYGISKSDCEVIREELFSMLKQETKTASIEFRNDLTCAGLFSEYWRSLTAGI